MRPVKLPGEYSPGFIKKWKSELPELPKWARENADIAQWAHEFMPFRVRVIRCTKAERGTLISESEAMTRRFGSIPEEIDEP